MNSNRIKGLGKTAIILPITEDHQSVQSQLTKDQIVKIKIWKAEKKLLTNGTSMIKVIGDYFANKRTQRRRRRVKIIRLGLMVASCLNT